jgi:hypothetical protein
MLRPHGGHRISLPRQNNSGGGHRAESADTKIYLSSDSNCKLQLGRMADNSLRREGYHIS